MVNVGFLERNGVQKHEKLQKQETKPQYGTQRYLYTHTLKTNVLKIVS